MMSRLFPFRPPCPAGLALIRGPLRRERPEKDARTAPKGAGFLARTVNRAAMRTFRGRPHTGMDGGTALMNTPVPRGGGGRDAVPGRRS